MYALGLFLGTNWGMIIVAVLAIVVCGLIAWFTRNWKAVVVAVAILAVIYGAQHMFVSGVNAEVARQVARKYKDLQDKLKLANEIADDHLARSERDAAEIEALKALAGTTPPNSDIGLTKEAADRVRAIQ